LNENSIKYCHWKSNEHLSESFCGRTDFDLLISDEDKSAFHFLAVELGLKIRYSTLNKVYPGMEDYIGLDENSGKLFHLHVHYKLILGKKNQKNYHLPFENLILSTSQTHEFFPIKIISPEFELLLLSIRSVLKIETGKKLLKNLFRKKNIIPGNTVREFKYLQQRINLALYAKLCNELFPQMATELIKFSRETPDNFSFFTILKLRRNFFRGLKSYKIFSGSEEEIELNRRKLASKKSGSWLRTGGRTIAFVGADGSGKSTTVAEIQKWLGWKLSVETFYMGLPKKKPFFRLLSIFSAVLNKLKLIKIKLYIDNERWLYAARFRFLNYKAGSKLSKNNKIILFDRFPLKEFWTMNEPMDGPRILAKTPQAEKERNYYHRIGKPDYLIILDVSPEESIRRKKTQQIFQPEKSVNEKIRAVNKLISSNRSNVILINTEIGREQSLLLIKNKIWEIL